MFEYTFVRIEVSNLGFKAKEKQDYHEIVHSYARDGWKLLQIFAPPTFGHGTASFFELIFEREKK